MVEQLWWFVAASVIVTAGLLTANALPHAQERAVLRLQVSVGIPLPKSLGETVRSRMVAWRRGTLVGGLIGLVSSALVATAGNDDQLLGGLAAWIVMGGYFAGSAIGVMVVAVVTASRLTSDHVRMARATAVSFNDFLAPIDRWMARLSVVLAVIAFAACAVAFISGSESGNPSLLISGGVLTAMAVASLVLLEAAGRRVVAKSIPVGSRDEMVWDDAFRAFTLRDLCFPPLVLGAYGVGVTASSLDPAAGPGSISIGVFLALFACVFLGLATAKGMKSQRHFLRRLWPELAAEAGRPRPVEADA